MGGDDHTKAFGSISLSRTRLAETNSLISDCNTQETVAWFAQTRPPCSRQASATASIRTRGCFGHSPSIARRLVTRPGLDWALKELNDPGGFRSDLMEEDRGRSAVREAEDAGPLLSALGTDNELTATSTPAHSLRHGPTCSPFFARGQEPSTPAREARMTKTVLFAHGLESGPRGRKARCLAAAGFAVVSEQMPCGRAHVARDPAVIAAAAAVVGVGTMSAIRWGVRGIAVVAGAALVTKALASAALTRRVLRRSVEVQTRALANHRVDVVVGSSFGGAVVLELLMRGLWSGPTVLLCPAHQLVRKRARMSPSLSLALLPDAVSSRIVVVHGRADETVPVAHSEALVAGSRARLIIVDDDHRLSASAMPERFVDWIALAFR